MLGGRIVGWEVGRVLSLFRNMGGVEGGLGFGEFVMYGGS